MLHGMRRPADFPHVRVSKDTVLEENGLGEPGIGPRIPAEPSELKPNMRGPAPWPIHAHAMKFHATLWGRDGGLTSDLGKRSQNARTKAHEWGGGTCRSLQNAHRFTMRACLRTRFLGGEIGFVVAGHLRCRSRPAGWLSLAVGVPKDLRRFAGHFVPELTVTATSPAT